MNINRQALRNLRTLLFVSVIALTWFDARADFLFTANGSAGTIGEYTTNGQVINPSLISGLFDPTLIALDGNGDLFVNTSSGVGEYTTSGATVNANLIPQGGSFQASAIACDGNGHLFIGDASNGVIREYSTSGTLLNFSLVSNILAGGIALNGNNMFVTNINSGDIEEFTTSGVLENSHLVTGLNSPVGIAMDGRGDLFVANNGGHTFGEYTISGATVNASLITLPGGYPPVDVAFDDGELFATEIPQGIGIYDTSHAPADLISSIGVSAVGIAIVPEPASMSIAVLTAAGLLLRRRRATAQF